MSKFHRCLIAAVVDTITVTSIAVITTLPRRYCRRSKRRKAVRVAHAPKPPKLCVKRKHTTAIAMSRRPILDKISAARRVAYQSKQRIKANDVNFKI